MLEAPSVRSLSVKHQIVDAAAILDLGDLDVIRLRLLRKSNRRHGRQEEKEFYRGLVVVPNLIPKVEIKIACNDDFVDITVEAILSSARSGGVGDGKIFITPLEACIRIRTGERGTEAI